MSGREKERERKIEGERERKIEGEREREVRGMEYNLFYFSVNSNNF